MSATSFRVLPQKQKYRQVYSDKRRRQVNKWLLIAGFTLPGIIMFCVFLLIPIFQSAYFSLFDWDGFGPLTDFMALGNYERILSHKIFQGAVLHSLALMLLSLTIQL